MENIFIKYNPYKLETEVTINGQAVKKNSALNVGEKRLQEWIESLPEVLKDECNSTDFLIRFHGTILDYEDLVSIANIASNNGINIQTEHIPAKEVADKEKAISEIFEEIQNGPFEELKSKDIKKAFNDAKSSEFPVNVVATMSAGKSTLINALLQQKLMPSKQEACTATITEIKDTDNDIFNATAYNSDDHLMETHTELSLQIMQSLNDNPEISKVIVEGNIPFVDANDVALVLVDTPGPNNSRDPEHKAATYRMLDESSKTLVLYIMNATQLAVTDDFALLSHVSDSMKVGGKQSKDRFLFVVNKLDEFSEGEDSVASAIEKVKKYLEDKGIENPNIFPASALTALNIRTILKDVDMENLNFDTLDSDMFGVIAKLKKVNSNEQLHLENYAPLTPSVRGSINSQLSEAVKNKDSKKEALIHTGIVSIEEAIKMYVLKYAKTAKIKNIVDTFAKRLEDAHSFENTKQEIAKNQEKKNEIISQIDAINRKLKSGEEAKKFKDTINNINYDAETQKIANDIIKEAQSEISSRQEKCTGKISKLDAESMCQVFATFADDLQAKVQVKLETIVTKQVEKNAKDLLEQYKAKIADLSAEIVIGDVAVDPFSLIGGEINTMNNAAAFVESMVERETVVVKEGHYVKNTNKKWYKPWTWFQESERWVDEVTEEKEYVDAKKLSNKFFAPILKQLIVNNKSAVDYAKEQAEAIKKAFSAEFDRLDNLLRTKLAELEKCANSQKEAEAIIKETEERLNWLNKINRKIEGILDI
jgi:predicted GTPase